MPTDIRNYFGNKSAQPGMLSCMKMTDIISKEDSKARRVKKRIIVSDDDDDLESVVKLEPNSDTKCNDGSEFEPTDVPSYFASSNKINRAAPSKIAKKRLPKKPKDEDEDDFFIPDDFDDMSIDNDTEVKDECELTRKRKATESPVVELRSEQQDIELKAAAKKSSSRVKKPRISKEDDPDSTKIKAIFDEIPTVQAPPPGPKDGFNYRDFASRGGPVAQGSKEIPVGAENCLFGLSFVLTGVLETVSREDASDLIKRHGGVMSAPTSKTDFVVLGSEAGPRKLETIAKHSLRTINEDGLFQLIKRLPANGGSGKQAQIAAAKREAEDKKVQEMAEELKPKTEAATILAKSQLWTDKYAPNSLKEICGNKGLVEKLQRWLRDWSKNLRANFKKPGPDGSGLYRAVLVSGPPGIGKTTACHLVAKLEGYDILEYNASDTRSKRHIDEQMRGVTDNTSLSGYFASSGNKADPTKRKLVIIMDEVDGMSGGDRGGVGQLNTVIKHTKIPIICICNDRKHQKLKPLDRTTLDMPFKRPSAQDMRSRLMSIAYREQLKLEPQAIDQLVAGTHNDIRQIINLLSTYKLNNSSMNMDQGKATSQRAQKHVILKPWDIVGKFLSGGLFHPINKVTLNEKIELYFNDHEFSYLMVQENYLKTNPDLARRVVGSPKEVNMKKLELTDKAAESISDADLVDALIHGTQQHWSLMPVHAVFSCVRPCSFIHGPGIGGQYSFTSWLGNNSKQGKTMRLLREIQSHMRLKTSGDKNEIRQSYLPVLFNRLAYPLIDKGLEAVEGVMETMDEYFLTKEDWDSIMEFGIGQQNGEQVLKQINAATKSAFTRKYNQASHPIPFLKAVIPTKAGTKRDVPDLEDAVEASDDDFSQEDNNDEDDISKDKLVKPKVDKTVKKPKQKQSKARAKSKGKMVVP